MNYFDYFRTFESLFLLNYFHPLSKFHKSPYPFINSTQILKAIALKSHQKMPQSKFSISLLVLLVVILFSLSVNAFAPRSFLKRDSARSFLKRDSTRSFLKREDPEVSPKMETTQSQASGSEEPKGTEEKRFDLGNEGFYGGPPQMKRFEMFDGYYEQPWAYPHNKRFDYLDGFYSGPGPAASGYFPFYAPSKRFDYGFGPRSRQLAAFL